MRVVVSGTHASGKSTLVADVTAALPDVEVLPDPYELVAEEMGEEPDAAAFGEQLQVAAERLDGPSPEHLVLAERGPLDLLAYLEALVDLGRPGRDAEAVRRGRVVAAQAMAGVDVVLLLDPDDVPEPDDEDPDLRRAMHRALVDLLDDPDLVGAAVVVDVAGDRGARLAQAVAAVGGR